MSPRDTELRDRVFAGASQTDGPVLAVIVAVLSVAAAIERWDVRPAAVPLVFVASLWPLVLFVPARLWIGFIDDESTRSRTAAIFLRTSLGAFPPVAVAAFATLDPDDFRWVALTLASVGLSAAVVLWRRGPQAPVYRTIGAGCAGLALGVFVDLHLGWDSLGFMIYGVGMSLATVPQRWSLSAT